MSSGFPKSSCSSYSSHSCFLPQLLAPSLRKILFSHMPMGPISYCSDATCLKYHLSRKLFSTSPSLGQVCLWATLWLWSFLSLSSYTFGNYAFMMEYDILCCNLKECFTALIMSVSTAHDNIHRHSMYFVFAHSVPLSKIHDGSKLNISLIINIRDEKVKILQAQKNLCLSQAALVTKKTGLLPLSSQCPDNSLILKPPASYKMGIIRVIYVLTPIWRD